MYFTVDVPDIRSPTAKEISLLHIGTAALLLLFSLSPAFAKCPTSKDRKDELFLTQDRPYLSLAYENTPDGLTESKRWFRNKKIEIVKAVYVHPLLVGKRTDKNGTLKLSYAESLAGIENLPNAKSWTSNVVLFRDKRMVNWGKEILTFKGWSQTRIGSCSYQVWVVDEQLALNGGAVTFTKYFSPDLGLVLRVVNMSPSGRVLQDITFDKIGSN